MSFLDIKYQFHVKCTYREMSSILIRSIYTLEFFLLVFSCAIKIWCKVNDDDVGDSVFSWRKDIKFFKTIFPSNGVGYSILKSLFLNEMFSFIQKGLAENRKMLKIKQDFVQIKIIKSVEKLHLYKLN